MPTAWHLMTIDADLGICVQVTHDVDIEVLFHFADSIIGFLGNLTAETRPIIEGDAMLFFNLVQSVFCKSVYRSLLFVDPYVFTHFLCLSFCPLVLSPPPPCPPPYHFLHPAPSH